MTSPQRVGTALAVLVSGCVPACGRSPPRRNRSGQVRRRGEAGGPRGKGRAGTGRHPARVGAQGLDSVELFPFLLPPSRKRWRRGLRGRRARVRLYKDLRPFKPLGRSVKGEPKFHPSIVFPLSFERGRKRTRTHEPDPTGTSSLPPVRGDQTRVQPSARPKQRAGLSPAKSSRPARGGPADIPLPPLGSSSRERARERVGTGRKSCSIQRAPGCMLRGLLHETERRRSYKAKRLTPKAPTETVR